MLAEKLNPAIPKRYLFLLAGTIWSLVGLILATVGLFWIFTVKQPHTLVLVLTPVAIIVGFIKGKFVLFKAANRTSDYIYSRPEKACFGSVFTWTTWLIICLMVTMGQLLRKVIVPVAYRDYLGLVYVLIGLALLTSSFVYWKNFFRYSKTPANRHKEAVL